MFSYPSARLQAWTTKINATIVKLTVCNSKIRQSIYGPIIQDTHAPIVWCLTLYWNKARESADVNGGLFGGDESTLRLTLRCGFGAMEKLFFMICLAGTSVSVGGWMGEISVVRSDTFRSAWCITYTSILSFRHRGNIMPPNKSNWGNDVSRPWAGREDWRWRQAMTCTWVCVRSSMMRCNSTRSAGKRKGRLMPLSTAVSTYVWQRGQTHRHGHEFQVTPFQFGAGGFDSATIYLCPTSCTLWHFPSRTWQCSSPRLHLKPWIHAWYCKWRCAVGRLGWRYQSLDYAASPRCTRDL